jgi:serine/threonine protein kinase
MQSQRDLVIRKALILSSAARHSGGVSMRKNETSAIDLASAQGKPFKTVFLSYRFADQAQFDVVQRIATRLRFFSIEVVLAQWNLDYGEDIKEFAQREIRKADAIIPVITDDYNRALLASSGPGEEVRFEVQAAIQEKASRPDFQIIPLLLDDVRHVPPFDRVKCAVPEAIDDVITQLGTGAVSGESRVIRQRYRIDRLIERRGFADVYHGWDMVADLPIEVYSVLAWNVNLKGRLDEFERAVKGRSSVSSPFLLNVRDTYIDGQGSYYLITERFDGMNLEVPLSRAKVTHPFGALCLAYQVLLALHELHSVGVIHGGLAPRCIRLNRDQTSCKVVDFANATPQEFVSRTAGNLAGYIQITPPERIEGFPVSVRQDLYQVGNLALRLILGKPALSRFASLGFWSENAKPLVVEDPEFPKQLIEELSSVVEKRWTGFSSGNVWLDERVRETSSRDFLAEALTPLLTWCLDPNPAERPGNCLVLLSTLKTHDVPVAGHLFDPKGMPVVNSLFPNIWRES